VISRAWSDSSERQRPFHITKWACTLGSGQQCPRGLTHLHIHLYMRTHTFI